MRPILPVTDVAVTQAAPPEAAGPAPQLAWLKIADLVVDDSYQRTMSLAGRRNVRAIAETFRWSAFSPVIVSPVVGGLYAIVDGQHRTTAAALCGYDSVPCQVIVAGRDEQAEAFRKINGSTTRIHPMHLFHAAVAAGDPAAVAAMEAARRAGVTILRNPTQIALQKRGQTCAFATIQSMVRDHGADLTVEALKAVMRPAQDERGMLVPPIMKAVVQVLAERLPLRPRDAVLAALDRVRLVRELDAATTLARQTGAQTTPTLVRLVMNRVDHNLQAAA
ncbi:DUF6551 family protein [Phreatobacter sp.]|uniref:DUF6551 family protein n=1 Tax=Phreatobacter sp. TaxID=1966341 RepID=UPI003F714D81